MAKFIPMINCGLHAGQSPIIWESCGREPFDTEEECEEWIDGNRDEFAPSEADGGIYAQEF